MHRLWKACSLCAGIALLLVVTPARADGKDLGAVVITASRLNQPAEALSQTVEVITREEIDHLRAASATEVLRQVPGANVIQQGGRGGVSSILLRGGEPNFTVVLIDGVQVNDPTNTNGGSYDTGSLEQAHIGRVETVLGAMSPVYGSDALSGVINLVTRGPDSGSDVSVETGTDGYGSASGFYGGSVADIGVGLGAHVIDDDGDVEGSDYKGRGLSGKFSGEFAGTGTAGLSLGYQSIESTSFPQDSGGPGLAVIRELDTRDIQEARAGLDIGYIFASRWQTGLQGSLYSRDEDYASPGIASGVLDGIPPNTADTAFDRKQLRASIGTGFPGNISALAGTEWKNETGTSAGFGDFELDRDTVSAFAEARRDMGSLVLQGGIRWDDPDAIDSVLTGRLGLLYRFPDGVTALRANWGEGFKAPSFFALAHPIVGNPALKPETAENIDVGIERRFRDDSGSMEFVVFRNEYDDLVDFNPELFINVNRDTVVTTGAQAAVQFAPIPRVNIRAHLTWLDTEIRDSDDTLRGRPEWRGGAVLDWEILPNWRLVT
ncbi:MAG: TonB-dependent receptor, partial [Gammaproteobacteria bacterium]|nr:TonB-dependent receptor [Gammaproteobacteria bacterium]